MPDSASRLKPASASPAGAVSIREWWRAHRAALLRLWMIGIFTSVLVTVASAMGWGFMSALQTQVMDLLTLLQPQRSAPEIVIVEIDEDTFRLLGRRQPIPREHLARLIQGLRRAGASVIGLDLFLDAPTTESEDGALARAITGFEHEGTSQVVLISSEAGTGRFASDEFRRQVMHGSSDVPRDAADRTVRNVQLLLDRPRPEPAFGLAIAARLAGMSPTELARITAKAGPLGTPIPVARWRSETARFTVESDLNVRDAESLRINFVGPPRTFTFVPSRMVTVLAEPATPVPEKNLFRDRIVLVGETFEASRDFQHTPHGTMAGVEIHANILHMLLTRTFIRPYHWAINLGLQAAFVLMAGVVMIRYPGRSGKYLCLGGVLLLALPASYFAFERGGYVMNFVLPVAAETYMRKWMTPRPGHIVERLRSRLWRAQENEVGGAATRFGWRRVEASVFVAEIGGIGTGLETRDGECVTASLVQHWDNLAAAITSHAGCIVASSGDAVLAVFAEAPRDSEHARRAVEAGLTLQRQLNRPNVDKASVVPALSIIVGIHSGTVLLGTTEEFDSRGYAIAGTPVTIARRVGLMDQEAGNRILVTEVTAARLGGRFSVRKCEEQVAAPGAKPLAIFEVIPPKDSGTSPSLAAK